TLSSLQRLASALEVGVADLLKGSGRTLEDEIDDLMSDEFISQIMPFLSQLDALQRSTLLAQVRDLSLHPRRSAGPWIADTAVIGITMTAISASQRQLDLKA